MGCKETDINRLGRWFHDNVSEICRKHYLRNVPLQAAICMSGVPSGGYYRIPRAASIEIGNIEKLRKDDDFRKIITHLVPGLLEKAVLAETAFCRPSEIPEEHRGIPSSTTNFNFLRSFTAAVAAFVQDAPIMVKQCEELKHIRPYKWLFDDEIKDEFARVQVRTFALEETDLNINEETILERRDVMHQVEAGFESMISTLTTNLPTLMTSQILPPIKDMIEEQEATKRLSLAHIHVQQANALLPEGSQVTIQNSPPQLQPHQLAADNDNREPIILPALWKNPFHEKTLIHDIIKKYNEVVLPRLAPSGKIDWNNADKSQHSIRSAYKKIYNKVLTCDEVKDGSKSVFEKAKEIDEIWNNFAYENGKFSDVRDAYLPNMSVAEFLVSSSKRRQETSERAKAKKKTRLDE